MVAFAKGDVFCAKLALEDWKWTMATQPVCTDVYHKLGWMIYK